MDHSLIEYVKTKRDAGVKDDQIRANLIATGWQADMVDAALKADLSGDAPPPPPVPVASAVPNHPVAVVNVATTKGIEYYIMFIGLWITATSIGFTARYN